MFIGISGYNHESAAALVNAKGILLDYKKEESLSRIKGDKSFPKRSIQRIIDDNGLNLEDIKAIAFYERPLTCFMNPIKVAAQHMPRSLGLLSHQFRNFSKSSIACYLDIASKFKGLEKKLIYLDHHLSHTLTALPFSTIQKDICSIVVDGFGDRSTTSISKVNHCYDIKELWSVKYPASLGLFYSAITDFLGFQVNEGEYKVMGLSSFGNSNSDLAKSIFGLIHWDDTNKNILLEMDYFDYHVSVTDSYSKKLSKLLGEPRNHFKSLFPEGPEFQRYADIARGAQDSIVYIMSKIFEHAYRITDCNKFLLSGGVAMNSASLDSLADLPFVEEIILPPSPGDAGAAIGAAYYSFLKRNKDVSSVKLNTPSLFPSKYESTHQRQLANKIISEKFEFLSHKEDQSLKISSELIQKGEVIGIIVGNSESGPRALGNRSLICNGKNHDAVKALNTVIKNRSPFRPTAPCMRIETAKKYYHLREELMQCYLSMSATAKCKPGSVSFSFPTTHVDGTARLQIVEGDNILNKLFAYLEPMGIDILANSSLNVSGDPTCFDLIDALMICSRRPLRYLLTDFGLLKVKV